MAPSSSQATAPLLPQFNPSSPSTSPSVSDRSHRRASSSADLQNMKQSRLTLARIMLLICISFMLMALVHIHYTNNIYRHKEEEYASSGQTANHSNEPIYTNDDHDNNDKAPHKIEPSFTTVDTTLTTTYTYSNGTRTKEFKPAFYQSAAPAQEEMGSFLKTLETRTWWPAPHREEVAARGLPATNKFFSYLPMGGGNNQFTSLQRAALLAKDLGRTLIIPPISPNSHIKVWAGPRYSEFYDLESFSAQSGIPVLEWHDVKQTPENPPSSLTHHWNNFGEDFPCIANGGIGVENEHLYDHFRPQFLMNFKSIAPAEDTTKGKAVDYSFARDVLLKDRQDQSTTDTMWKCLSCPYFLNGPDLNDRAWKEIGLHMKFNAKVEAMADEILDTLLPRPTASTTRRHPEFIIVHLRRGDIVTKCKPGQDEKDCLVQIEEIAEKVDEIEKQRRIKALAGTTEQNADVVFERLPVLVTTNEKRPKELEKLEKLGWVMLDHGDAEKDEQGQVKPSTTKKLGTMTSLGPFYPPMLDAVLLTRGDYLIGMSNSRMSQLATQRGAAWYGHSTWLL
ncbi:hypothetical protein KI688_011679 [Linnemannia hyalina]|uniref:GDP-fucose protein O-fucosyltransferase 2 n=1 Tax=Linnemannia hyalina TaxID=64524 RepID=A0A9P7XVU9_9FUNG|nr:hypothetical protein KI688_011679 [Linnemannia hyalina]